MNFREYLNEATKIGQEAVYQGPNKKYKEQLVKIESIEGSNVTIRLVDVKNDKKLTEVPLSDLRFVK